MILEFDAKSGSFQSRLLPDELCHLGGRALAVALLADCPEPGLVLAPGLLANVAGCSSSRASLCTYLPEFGRFSVSSAGGPAARALAALDLQALMVRGRSQDTSLSQLIIDQKGARLEKADLDLGSPSTRMEALTRYHPDAQAIITVSRLGSLRVAFASTTFSCSAHTPSSHAGSSSGLLLAQAGLNAIVLGGCSDGQKSAPALITRLSQELRRLGLSCTLGCATCRVRIQNGGEPGLVKQGLPEFLTGPQLKRFFALCNELEVNRSALYERLHELMKSSRLPSEPELVLKALEELQENPEKAPLLPLLQDWLPRKKQSLPSPARFLADSLGLCRFAGNSLDKKEGQTALEAIFHTLSARTLTDSISLEKEVRSRKESPHPSFLALKTAAKGGTAPTPVRLCRRLWFECDGEQVMGSGMIHLLLEIRRLGSLKKAAESLGMPYRGAWGRIRKAEEALGLALLSSSRQRQKGVALTAAALSLVDAFSQLDAECQAFLSKRLQEFRIDGFDIILGS